MDALGYDHVKYSKPFRMPMFTFWKRTRLQLMREKSANRTVITVFKPIRTAAGLGGDGDGKLFAVVNCHLSAGDHGDAPRKRLQQVADGLETARKELGNATGKPAAKKKNGGGAAAVPEGGGVCVVGDFNRWVSISHLPCLVVHGYVLMGCVCAVADFDSDATGKFTSHPAVSCL